MQECAWKAADFDYCDVYLLLYYNFMTNTVWIVTRSVEIIASAPSTSTYYLLAFAYDKVPTLILGL